ncbi:MAG TPA: 23S rRNA (guanosine(2251)-2'-O)-methyltransferase RlmB [Candidatus Avipropionibacterium avicola]|uniref:23S rRNA (Guanosine(2251)-2'-O)-methyltransferase RlmB n=1 Tax=Candidatus Avipropionibacterium avicola TaxID=2840701 RepID=A0A9D1KNM6_9ACTN|nr:23S rRNA (guanosine(2251)-2'-O)-methyltransferase RlmB [Candidatus Avipropionibacterium avicola]
MPAGQKPRPGRSRGKGVTAGSGGRNKRSLAGRGPTPKAEDRPYHKAHKAKQARQAQGGRRPSTNQRPPAGPEWVVGRNSVLEALQAEIPVKTAYVAEGADRDERLRDILKIAAARSMPLLEVTRAELDRLTGGAVHQAVALQLPAYEYLHPDDLLATALDTDNPVVVALDHINDPRNLGAIIRSAAAFGATGVVIPERRSAGMTAAAWKTSAGAAARIPVARATNLNRALQSFSKAGFTLAGLDAEGGTDIGSLPGASGPVLLVVGSEGSGLTRLAREACDHLVQIPIATEVESLNAGVAAGVALYEISRQR